MGHPVVRYAGRRTIEVSPPAWELFRLAWSYVVLPTSPSGDPSFVTATALAPVLIAIVGVWALGWTALRARRGDPLPALLVVWALGYALLVAISGTWFWCQAYPMAVPLALWLVAALRDGIAAARERRAEAFGLAPLAVLLAAQLQHATPIRGLDRDPIRGHFRNTRAIDDAIAAFDAIEGPGVVWTGLPVRGDVLSSTTHWVRLAGRRRGLDVRVIAGAVPWEETRPKTLFEVVDLAGAPHLVPTEEIEWVEGARERLRLMGPRDVLPLRALSGPRGQPAWILGVDGPDHAVPVESLLGDHER